jgi:hypothetical protein
MCSASNCFELQDAKPIMKSTAYRLSVNKTVDFQYSAFACGDSYLDAAPFDRLKIAYARD